MNKASNRPLGLLAELTYRCPLHCPYCSNPLNLSSYSDELPLDEWVRVFSEARTLGVLQLHLSGGEPLQRRDLVEIVGQARELGFYTNLITSALALTPAKAAQIPSFPIENVRLRSLERIWDESPLFNRFRGTDWMPEPCRSCPRQHVDFGGCRCQAFQLTGEAAATDPVCHLSPHHALVADAVWAVNSNTPAIPELIYRSFDSLDHPTK